MLYMGPGGSLNLQDLLYILFTLRVNINLKFFVTMRLEIIKANYDNYDYDM